MANGSNGAKEDRIWLALCTATGVAVDVTLNKYSAILPGIAVLLLWAIPAVLFVVWFWRVEKTRDWVKSRFLEHPVSYALMFLILIPFAWQATATVVSKLSLPAAKRQTAKTDPHIAGVVSHPPSAAPIAPPPAAAPIARRKPTHSAPDHSAQPAPTPAPQSGAQTVNCDNAGNCAGTNSGYQIVNQYGPPPPTIITSFDVPQPEPSKDGHPRISFKFYTNRVWTEGTFAIICNRDCHLVPDQLCGLPGMNPGTSWGTVTGHPNMPGLDFHRDFPAAYWCQLTVESATNDPITIQAVKTLNITDNKPPETK